MRGNPVPRLARPGAAAATVLMLLAGGCSLLPFRSRPEPTPPPQAAADSAAAGPRERDRTGSYESVTRNADTRVGLFTTHRVADTLFFEIPRSELGKDMLLLRRTAAGTPEIFSDPARVVVWELENGKVVLRDRAFTVRASEGSPLERHVQAQLFGSYIASFDVVSYGPDSSLVVNVTPLFTTNRGEFVGVRNIATDRSFIEHVAAFPENVNVTAVQTGVAAPMNSGPNAPSVANSVRLEWSLLKLPEEPMMPRLYDSRVGYLTVDYTGYDDGGHGAEPVRYIRRFRLEKKDPTAEVSEPVEPIVFWIDRATPEWLVPWVIRGVEEWRPAFEEAGFRNAIEARIPPSEEEDPDWSPHDARHSMIYWRASTTRNATGGQVVDPRTGEILKAEVTMYHSVMALLRNWYFVQAGPLDPRARELPLPDSLMGRLVQYVVAHEVGHAIGLPHNFKASYTVPADSVRSVTFLERMGSHTPTLMAYSRFNYVAQPEDSIPVELLIPKVGPYDRFAIAWGHRPIPGARTPQDELPTLDAWARVQDTVPWLRYQTPGATNDPGDVTEAVGNADPVQSGTLALANLRRVMSMVLDAAERPGEDYSLLRELYDAAVSQWGNYMRHVAAFIGGADSQERRGTGERFFPLSRARQVEAMRFLIRNAFQPPSYLLDREILRRLEPSGAVTRIAAAQRQVVDALFLDSRLALLIEYEALAERPGQAYTVGDLARDTRQGIWSELGNQNVRINVYRRNLQRLHLAALDRAINGGSAEDARPILRGDLIELDRLIEQAIPRAADVATRLHLEDARYVISTIIDPEARWEGFAANLPTAAPSEATSGFAGAIAGAPGRGAELVIEDCFNFEGEVPQWMGLEPWPW